MGQEQQLDPGKSGLGTTCREVLSVLTLSLGISFGAHMMKCRSSENREEGLWSRVPLPLPALTHPNFPTSLILVDEPHWIFVATA